MAGCRLWHQSWCGVQCCVSSRVEMLDSNVIF